MNIIIYQMRKLEKNGEMGQFKYFKSKRKLQKLQFNKKKTKKITTLQVNLTLEIKIIIKKTRNQLRNNIIFKCEN